MTHKVTLTLQIGQIRHEATLNLPPGFTAPDILTEEQDALVLLAILQYTARKTLEELGQELLADTPTKEAAE